MQTSKSKRTTPLQSDLSHCFRFDLSESLNDRSSQLLVTHRKHPRVLEPVNGDCQLNLKNVLCVNSSNMSMANAKMDEPFVIGSINSRSTADFDSSQLPEVILGKVDFGARLATSFNKISVRTMKEVPRVVKRESLRHFFLKKSNFMIASAHQDEPIQKTPRYLILKNLRLFRKGIKRYQQKKRVSKSTIFSPLVFNQWSPKVTCCSCKSSKCVKMYCECFKTRGYCLQQCRCSDCLNNKQLFPVSIRDVSFSSEVESPVKKMIER